MTSVRRLPVIMDVDTGVDDAVALLLATCLPELVLLGVTTVAGNVALDLTTENTLRVLAAAGHPEIPVYRGMAAPLARPHLDAAAFHGANGLAGVELPRSPATVSRVTAPEFIVQSLRQRPGELTLICVAPLTNLAVALRLEPELPRLVRRVVVMGGVFQNPGNVTAYAEFNIWADPEAAAEVALSELPLTFVGLDVTHQTGLERADWEALAEQDGGEARLIHALLRQSLDERGRERFHLHDPLAVGIAAWPELVTTERWGVAVQVGTVRDVGLTALSTVPALPRHEVALAVDAAEFRRRFDRCLHLG
ncbi:MAG TPA: nucleoside hydrolase [Thermomicrobiaceae bacterium]|nr:nucleoside hydrolase [Thermomicrobiaceae bacterium]